MISDRRLSVILPSFNDARILRAIQSIRRFDDISTVKILVIDSGSSKEVLDLIRSLLSQHDTLIAEPDNGIFDALNKGLNICSTDFIGWLGSDDLYSGDVPASYVLAQLANSDLVVADALHFREGLVTRVTHSLPCRLGLVGIGLHNPHFSTFGTASLLKSERFDLALRGSDIDYFLRIFSKHPRVVAIGRVAALLEEGGFSNSSLREILRTNTELLQVYARHSNWFQAFFAVTLKLMYKSLSRLWYRFMRLPVRLPAQLQLR